MNYGLGNKRTFICAAITPDLCCCQVLFNSGESDNLISSGCCDNNPFALINIASASGGKKVARPSLKVAAYMFPTRSDFKKSKF